MDRRFASGTGDRVYQAIKAGAIRYAFPGGQRIYLQPLADALGVSTTPIREALNRLAAEDLVIKAPRKGFIAIGLSEDNLRGYYELSRRLVTQELEKLDTAAQHKLGEYEPIAGVLYKLNRRTLSDAEVLALYAGQVFYDIAALSENAHAMRLAEHANDQLFLIRTVECRHLENVQGELKLLCELLLAGRCDELLERIGRYHEQRIGALTTLLNIARR